MSEIRLYLDEDAIDQQLIRAFRSRNIDVITVAEVQAYGFSDAEQLAVATAQQRSLLSMWVITASYIAFVWHSRSIMLELLSRISRFILWAHSCEAF